jgi:hypothetical protein
MSVDGELRRDQFAAFMVAERDAEVRGCAPVEVVRWPDVEDRETAAVELIAQDSEGALIAVEHTVIESYTSQIAERASLDEMFPMGGPNLLDVPNAGQYRLVVQVDELLGIRRRHRGLVEPKVRAWTEAALPSAPWPHVPGTPTFVRGRIQDPDLELSLERWTDSTRLRGPLAQVVRVGFWRPADLESRRAVRMASALNSKLPKLLSACAGARTILVLEDRDMFMSAPAFVSRAMAADAPESLPDVIYHLNVAAGDPVATPLYAHGSWWHEQGHGLLTFPTSRAARFNGLEP